jgi:succinate-semialdehyde dehydrogenase/glutarate-semialdehyde dehydrogenase
MISELTLKDRTLLRDACPVAGEWVAADSGGTIAVGNPSTGAVIGHVPIWGQPRPGARSSLLTPRCRRGVPDRERARGGLRRWFDLMMANQDDLGAIMTAEQRKPLTEAGALSRLARLPRLVSRSRRGAPGDCRFREWRRSREPLNG